jgi:hypothetical protein
MAKHEATVLVHGAAEAKKEQWREAQAVPCTPLKVAEHTGYSRSGEVLSVVTCTGEPLSPQGAFLILQ